MPIVDGSDFNPAKPFSWGHFNTISSYFYRNKVETIFDRHRIDTPDGDFLDLDFLKIGSHKLAILCHGLEGSSSSNYIHHFSRMLSMNGWNILAMNYRGCSGEINRRLQMYNSGKTDDLDHVVKSVEDDYDRILLIGFSLGGNLILKYLGENKDIITPKISGAVAISAPVHLSDSSKQLLRVENMLYQIRFLVSLAKKIIQKKGQFPDKISLWPLLRTWNLYAFDNNYTAPIFGYKDAEDYYAHNQSLPFLKNIKIPTLIINALDDPFLGNRCYPYDVAKESDVLSLCTPKYGGHVGFARAPNDRSWIDNKILAFIKKYPINRGLGKKERVIDQ